VISPAASKVPEGEGLLRAGLIRANIYISKEERCKKPAEPPLAFCVKGGAMKRIVLCVVVTLASSLSAQMVPGWVVKGGFALPVVADLNRDGLDDLIQDRTVLVNAGGSFSAPVDLGLESSDRVIEVLDANGDGWPDLLTSDGFNGQSHYRLYLATGGGGFSAASFIPTQSPPYVADVDGDGMDDLITTIDVFKGMIRIATDLTVWRSNGVGSFSRLNTYRIPPYIQILPGYRVLAGDLNHDGNPDLVIRCLDELVVMRGTGGGSFEVESRFLPHPYGINAKALADIDGDGNLDFVLAEQREVLAFLGDGRGNFPRVAAGTIEKKHEMVVPAFLGNAIREGMQQPKDLAIGNFTTSRTQIAAGTAEGDVVILEYHDGVLREVARNQTEFLLTSVRVGSFVSTGHSDLEASGTLAGATNGELPSPRLLIGMMRVPTAAPRPITARARTVRNTFPESVRYTVMTRGGCASNDAVWTLRHEGMFNTGTSTDGGRVDAFIKGDWMWYRLNVPYAIDSVGGILLGHGDTYTGTVAVKTNACDWQIVDISATVAH
jgi:hypothetical protein